MPFESLLGRLSLASEKDRASVAVRRVHRAAHGALQKRLLGKSSPRMSATSSRPTRAAPTSSERATTPSTTCGTHSASWNAFWTTPRSSSTRLTPRGVRNVKRNRRAGVEDRWDRSAQGNDGVTVKTPSASHGVGSCWRARYVDSLGKEHAKSFSRKIDAQHWLKQQVSDQVTGTWTDPVLSGVTFGAIAER